MHLFATRPTNTTRNRCSVGSCKQQRGVFISLSRHGSPQSFIFHCCCLFFSAERCLDGWCFKQDIRELLRRAQGKRVTAATNSNARSSRSHMVVEVCVSQESKLDGQKMVSTLNLVDLAGSERVSVSGSIGERCADVCVRVFSHIPSFCTITIVRMPLLDTSVFPG